MDNDVPVLVKQTGTEVNLEVECKSHINLFHTLFFTLPPDDEFIKYNMEKAMYLIDDSGLKQYNNLKEKGYFNTILASSATVTIMTDSIKVDMNNLSFEYYGIQRIERETSILKRQLVTTGKLRQIPRTENNPHGLIITDWKTILNKDLDYKSKKEFLMKLFKHKRMIEKKVSRLKPSKLQLFFLLKYFKSSELITLVNAYWRGLIYTVKLCLELRFHSFLSSQFYH